MKNATIEMIFQECIGRPEYEGFKLTDERLCAADSAVAVALAELAPEHEAYCDMEELISTAAAAIEHVGFIFGFKMAMRLIGECMAQRIAV